VSDERLDIASFLLASGAGASARRVLGEKRGAPANRLRLKAREASLEPGVYALVTLPEGGGAVVPLRPTPGRSRAADPAFREACDRALDEARAHLRAPSLPALRFAFEEWLSVFGPSIGLPAALAFVAHYAPARAPREAVLATGRLGEGGRLERVGHLAEKLAAADAEREVGLVVMPAADPAARGEGRAATLREAIALVFGEAPIHPDARHVHLDSILQRVHAERDAARGVELLEAVPREALAPADRARVLLELGSQQRHLGRSAEAVALHDEARALLGAERAVIGAEAAERYELECWATALDDFRVEETIAALSARLAEPFLKLRNELRCRGMLAQAVSMAGRFAEAARLRAENLPLHQRSDALRKVAPATHGYLALDAAWAGDAPTFEAESRAMLEATRPGDEAQERYDAAVMVRGLGALDRHAEALSWARAHTTLFARRGPLGAHPEPTTARALGRALRRVGAPREALALLDRVRGGGPGLAGFCAAVAALEGSLAQDDLGEREEAAARRARARQTLLAAHPAGARWHAALFDAEGEALERAIDRVWY
jgi:hypothetical protein